MCAKFFTAKTWLFALLLVVLVGTVRADLPNSNSMAGTSGATNIKSSASLQNSKEAENTYSSMDSSSSNNYKPDESSSSMAGSSSNNYKPDESSSSMAGSSSNNYKPDESYYSI
ncbi:hypothetical protein LSM04_001727 [Trypanosoma melophagium]|uniref:uncharacterized protein n=1 Tax=Trypanosoma melophagium TaxID=715481 RepID=UPI00351AAB2E|nr:hypothetical protein LSM04_001727 [Trypanosoma melophagium]